MKSLVIDGSTTLSFLIRDGFSPYAMRALQAIENMGAVYVASHWWLEITNGLLMAERRKRTSQPETAEALRLAKTLPVDIDDETASRCIRETMSLARQYALTVYDAAYLELAMRRRSGLATVDKALAKAAAAAGVELLV